MIKASNTVWTFLWGFASLHSYENAKADLAIIGSGGAIAAFGAVDGSGDGC